MEREKKIYGIISLSYLGISIFKRNEKCFIDYTEGMGVVVHPEPLVSLPYKRRGDIR